MSQGIGTAPRYEPDWIKDPSVRGYVKAAIRHALKQKKPAEAVKEFSDDIGRKEFSRFEKKYGVPAARLKHQLRSRHAGEMLKETRKELDKLAQDLARAEEYWEKIFTHITCRYFKDRAREIMAALKEAQWYPYLRIEKEAVEYGSRRKERILYSDNRGIMLSFMPTDRKQETRYKRLDGAEKIYTGGGWMFLRNSFGAPIQKPVECIITENIQRPKISDRISAIKASKYRIQPIPRKILDDPELYLDEKSSSEPTEKEELIFQLHDENEEMQMIASGLLDFNLREVLRMLGEIDNTIKGLERYPELKNVYIGLKKWRQDMPGRRELEKKAHLYSPQALYPLDFLPAMLASIYCLEKEYPAEMRKTKALLLDMKGIMTEGPDAYLDKVERPKEMQDYLKLAKALGAREIGQNMQIAMFGQET